MSEKLTEQKIDEMIKELIRETTEDPLDKQYDKEKLKYYKGKQTFHNFDDNNSLQKNRSKYKPSRVNLSSLSDVEEPNDKLDLKDIKKALYQLVLNDVTAIKSKQGQYLDWLYLSKKDLELRGTDDQKKYWNAAIIILNTDYRAQKKAQDSEDPNAKFSRYNMFSKLGDGNAPSNYYIQGFTPSNDPHFKENWLQIEFDPDPAEEEIITFPDTTEIQSDSNLFNLDIANKKSELGQFPAGVAKSADVVFAGTKNLIERLRLITSMTEEFVNPTPNQSNTIVENSKQYAKVVFYDYINSMTRNMDDRASAYFFESFLALCAGGRVEGAVADEESGVMGATDFTIGTEGNVKGSCKYYSSINSKLKQAVSGFERNTPMHYVVAIKNKDKGSDQTKIIKEIKIYYYKVIVDKLQTKTNVRYFAPNGQLLDKIDSLEGSDVPLNKTLLYREETTLGTIKLLGDTQEEYKEVFKTNLNTLNTDLSNLVTMTSDITADSRQMNRNTRQYIMQNDKDSGDQAVGDLNRVIANMQSLFNSMVQMGFESTTEKITTKLSATKESKLQSLDDLIMETIRDIKKKRKK